MPKVFTFNLAWASDQDPNIPSQGVEELLDLLILIPNIFEPFTFFKQKTN